MHDRVVSGRRKTCPDCGTPLIAIPKEGSKPGPIRPEADVEIEAGSVAAVETTVENDPKILRLGTPALAAIVTGIILVSFLMGLAIPRGSSKARAGLSTTPPTKTDIAVNLTRIGAGVRLRLESFSQRGATVVLRVAVPDDPRIDTGLIQGITVAFSQDHVELARIPMPTRATPEGFIAAAGVPDLAHAHIDSVRIAALTVGLAAPLGGASGGMIGLDLAGVWPVPKGKGPLLKRVGTTVKLDDGRTVRVDSLVGWPDHLEARLEVHGQPFNWDYNETYGLAFDGFGGATGKVDSQAPTGITRYVNFVDINHATRRAGLQINVTDFTVNGDWIWPLAPGA